MGYNEVDLIGTKFSVEWFGGGKEDQLGWENVQKSKKEGGLGVKDLEAINVVLLSKWRWRCI